MNGNAAYRRLDEVANPVLIHVKSFVQTVLHSFSQVVFAKSLISGLFILVAVFIASPRAGIYSLLSTSTAFFFAPGKVNEGLYGFNAQLIGMAIAVFNPPSSNIHTYLFEPFVVVFLSLFSIVLCDSLSFSKKPYLTIPFNVCVVMFFAGVYSYGHYAPPESWNGHLPTSNTTTITTCLRSGSTCEDKEIARDLAISLAHGVSQIFILENVWSGLLILCGLLVYSPLLSLCCLVGSGIGTLYGVLFGCDGSIVWRGLYGYNSALTMMGIIVFMGTKNWWKALLGAWMSCVCFGAAGTIMGML